jgi:pilus assembly protein CpaC
LKNAGDYWPTAKEPRLKRISAIDEKIIDVQIVDPKSFYVFGKDFGSTSLIVWEKDQEDPIKVDVIVFLDVTSLKQKLSELYPNQKIDVYASETGVVLSGTVTGPEIVEQVLRLTQTFMPKKAEGTQGQQGTGRSGVGITNLLEVAGNQQVMLEVKFAEVTRNSVRDWQAALGLGGLGKDFTGAAGVAQVIQQPLDIVSTPAIFPGGFPGTITSGQFANGGALAQQTGSLLLNFAANPANIFINIDNLTTALQFLETEGLARTLAEPRLVTQSGQEASFLAGGEFPIPVPQVGSGGGSTITIEFREFGVGLRFTPVILSDGRISLRVAPSVTEISSVSSIPAGIQGANFNVPNLNTRKLETTVQMHDGQTLALAGLLQDNTRESVRKIPGLGDIPILGALFRSSSFTQNKTDLLIAVTPHIVKPVKEGDLTFPGEFMQIPNRFEFYLEGRLEGRRSPGDIAALSRHSFTLPTLPMETRGGLEGDFGPQPIQPVQQ